MKKCLLIVLVLSSLSFSCARTVRVEGMAMLPTIKDGERLIINTSHYELKRGDIVLHLYPKDQTKSFIKRIIGLPNETIEIKAGKVFIDGKELEENYLDQTYNQSQTNLTARKIETDSYFVMGDNRDNSSDSRVWGTLKKELVQGTVWDSY